MPGLSGASGRSARGSGARQVAPSRPAYAAKTALAAAARLCVAAGGPAAGGRRNPMTAIGCSASLDRRENSLVLAKVRHISLDNQNSGVTFQKFPMTILNSLLNENNSLRPPENSL